MAAAEEHTRSGLSRRDALRLLAASTGTVAAASAIVSQPALAANGSEGCTFSFSADPQVTVQAVNVGGNNKDVLNISVAPITGRCPCSPLTFEYSYRIVTRSSATAPGATAEGGTGWTSWSTVSVTSPTVLWPTGGGNPDGVVTVAVAVRVTCGNTTVCRSGSAGPFPIANPNGSLTRTFGLASDVCPSSDASGNVGFAAGAQMMRTFDAPVDEPAVDLGPVEPAPETTEASTTTSTTTTTTEGPALSESSTSSTSTSTTSTSSTPTPPSDE